MLVLASQASLLSFYMVLLSFLPSFQIPATSVDVTRVAGRLDRLAAC